MKSILVNYTGSKGGGAEYAYEMTKALSKQGFKMYAIISEKVSNVNLWDNLGIEKIVKIKTYNSAFGVFIRFFIIKFLQKKRIMNQLPYYFDYIYVPMEQPLTKTINNFYKKAKVLLTVHDVDPHIGDSKITHLIGGLLNYNIRKNSYRVLLLSKIFITRYIEKYHYGRNQIIVVKHGYFEKFRNITSKKIDLDFQDDINFMFFGRISEYKGIDVLLKAFINYYKDNENCTLTIAGFGDMSKYQELMKTAEKINVINRWITDEEIAYLFRVPNCILITPYKDASQSGVITLANIMKVPVISSNTGGLSEQVIDNVSGLLFENGDVGELVYKMNMLKNNDLIKELTNSAYNNGQLYWQESAEAVLTSILGEKHT